MPKPHFPEKGGPKGKSEVTTRVDSQTSDQTPDSSDSVRFDPATSTYQQLLVDAQALAGLGCFEWDLATGRLTWSDELYRIYGLPQGSVNSLEDFVSRVHPNDLPLVQKSIQDAIAAGSPFHHRERIQCDDGEWRYLESRGRCIKNAQGEVIRLIGACLDVTEQRLREIALESQNRNLSLLADAATELLPTSHKPSQRMATQFVRIAERFTFEVTACYTIEDDSLSLWFSKGVPPEGVRQLQRLKRGEQLCGMCFASGETLYLNETQLHAEPIAELVVSMGVKCYISVPLFSEGDIIGLVTFGSVSKTELQAQEIETITTFANIVAAAQARDDAQEHLTFSEAKLRAIEQRHRMAVTNARMVVWEASLEHDFTFVSGSCEQLLGVPGPSWCGPGFWLKRIHPEDVQEVLDFRQRVAAGRDDEGRMEYRVLTAHGAYLWIEEVAEYIDTSDADPFLRGVIADVTRRRELEEQLRQSQKMEAIGRLAGGVAHDFNNLLTVINSYCDTLLLEHQDDEQTLSSLSAIRDAGQRAADLTGQLLVFSRNSVRRQGALNIHSLLKGIRGLLTRLVGDRINLSMELDAKNSRIQGDPSRFQQLIMNLAVNARDAMPDGGNLLISTNTLFRTNRDKESEASQYVQITVRDEGCGMTDAVRAKIFEPFFTTKPINEGTGLGLAVVYGVVQQCRGKISVSTRPGEGTTFRIQFPTLQDGEAQTPTPVHGRGETTEGNGTILLVEDQDNVRRVVALALESKGYAVLAAATAEQALELARGQADVSPITLVLTDLVMPNMNGKELADVLEKEFPDLPILFMSGFPDNVSAFGLGNRPFIAKPFTADTLAAKLHEVMRNVQR